MYRSKLVQVVGCLILVGAGWISGDRVQAETTIQVDRPVVNLAIAEKPDGLKLSTNSTALASLEVKASAPGSLQTKATTASSKQQRLIDDIKDSPLSSSRLLPDVGAFR
jgi:hypothetical protein